MEYEIMMYCNAMGIALIFIIALYHMIGNKIKYFK